MTYSGLNKDKAIELVGEYAVSKVAEQPLNDCGKVCVIVKDKSKIQNRWERVYKLENKNTYITAVYFISGSKIPDTEETPSFFDIDIYS